MHPVLFELPAWLGGHGVPTYGLFLALGILVGSAVFAELAARTGHDRGRAFEIMLEIMLVSFLSSKTVGLLFQPASDVSLLRQFATTGGVWYVGFLTGVGWAALRIRQAGIPTRHALDLAAAGVAAGHGLGRLACFFAGCCWGRECSLPWAVRFESETAHLRTGVPLGVSLHPVQLYESGAELLLAALLCWMILRRRYRFHLQPGLTYLAAYAAIRFALEFLRADVDRGRLGPFSTSQWIAIGVFAASAPLLLLGWRRGTLDPRSPAIPGGEVRRA